jgi:hypothetical protein
VEVFVGVLGLIGLLSIFYYMAWSIFGIKGIIFGTIILAYLGWVGRHSTPSKRTITVIDESGKHTTYEEK